MFFLFTQPELISQHSDRIIYIIAGSGQNSIGEYSNVTLWFLPFLFTISIIHYFTTSFSKARQYIAIILICVFAQIFRVIEKPLPYSLDTAFTLYPFFWVGTQYFLNIKPLITSISVRIQWLYIILLFCIYSISVIYNSNVDTASNVIGNVALFYVGAFSAITVLTIIAEQIQNIKFLNFLGKNSLTILIFHIPILLLLRKFFDYLAIKPSIYTDISYPIITVVLCIPIITLINICLYQ